MSDSEDANDNGLHMFDEPEGYFQPEKQPTTVSHATLSGHILSLRLIGHSPLWVGEADVLYWTSLIIPFHCFLRFLRDLIGISTL